ncbi:hypothetical protein [Actinosynnema sp. NPDC020468]|uniref:hypothetical protein n=1 Tax=Actinosynnema sp. NPDC020468 TaxID=3154488 RepID=UPI0033D48698
MPVTTRDHAATGYGVRQALWMVEAAQLAYQSRDTVEETCRDRGFDRVRHHEKTFTPPFPLQDSQASTAASDDTILVGFRGTEPEEDAGLALRHHHAALAGCRRHRVRPSQKKTATLEVTHTQWFDTEELNSSTNYSTHLLDALDAAVV